MAGVRTPPLSVRHGRRWACCGVQLREKRGAVCAEGRGAVGAHIAWGRRVVAGVSGRPAVCARAWLGEEDEQGGGWSGPAGSGPTGGGRRNGPQPGLGPARKVRKEKKERRRNIKKRKKKMGRPRNCAVPAQSERRREEIGFPIFEYVNSVQNSKFCRK